MMDREQIIAANPIVPFLEGRGCMIRAGKTNRCALTQHKPMHYCVSIDLEKQVWCCNDCQKGGSVIDWLMIEHDITAQAAMEKLGGATNGHTSTQPAQRQQVNGGVKPKITKTYDYTDTEGKQLFQVVRLEPKDFRQRRMVDGKWVWNLEGIQRVLYNLPKVIRADVVFVCEGEKDCETIARMGLVATTNVGGAKKWLPEYTAYFRGKEVVILPDNDKPGQEHLDLVRTALAKVAKSMRVVQMPEGIKDVSEFAATFPTIEECKEELIQMCEAAECLHKGESVPVQTMAEMQQDYKAYIKRIAQLQFSLSRWLPSLVYSVRPLVPGDLAMILASTGTGKTAILQNIALNAGIDVLLIEKEIANVLTFERFEGMVTSRTGAAVESAYRGGTETDWSGSNKLNHLVCCHKRLSTDGIKKLIENTALKTSTKPALVLLDYVQLIPGKGERYERTSDTAESLKAVALETNTIIITASQVARKDKKKEGSEATREVSLSDGKDSGSIENSAGLVLGAWRDADDYGRMWVRVLKNTKGIPGKTVPCRFHETLLITEEAEEPNP